MVVCHWWWPTRPVILPVAVLYHVGGGSVPVLALPVGRPWRVGWVGKGRGCTSNARRRGNRGNLEGHRVRICVIFLHHHGAREALMRLHMRFIHGGLLHPEIRRLNGAGGRDSPSAVRGPSADCSGRDLVNPAAAAARRRGSRMGMTFILSSGNVVHRGRQLLPSVAA
jgi:hypothetical protein